MQRWEYRLEVVYLENGVYVLDIGGSLIHGKDIWDFLMSLGELGWEMISVVTEIGDTNP